MLQADLPFYTFVVCNDYIHCGELVYSHNTRSFFYHVPCPLSISWTPFICTLFLFVVYYAHVSHRYLERVRNISQLFLFLCLTSSPPSVSWFLSHMLKVCLTISYLLLIYLLFPHKLFKSESHLEICDMEKYLYYAPN